MSNNLLGRFWKHLLVGIQAERNKHRSSRLEVFLIKGILKICSKFTGEHPHRSVISIKLQSYFIEITLRHGCSPVNLLHIFRTSSSMNTSGWLLLERQHTLHRSACYRQMIRKTLKWFSRPIYIIVIIQYNVKRRIYKFWYENNSDKHASLNPPEGTRIPL